MFLFDSWVKYELNMYLCDSSTWTCNCPCFEKGHHILPEIYTFVLCFRVYSFQQLSVCFSALYYCPCVAGLSCCSNVLAALADRNRWLSVYLLTYGLREQCRHFSQCWQIRRGLWPRTAALKANWCLQAGTWGIVLIFTLIIVLASALALSSQPREIAESSPLQEFNERTQVKKDC